LKLRERNLKGGIKKGFRIQNGTARGEISWNMISATVIGSKRATTNSNADKNLKVKKGSCRNAGVKGNGFGLPGCFFEKGTCFKGSSNSIWEKQQRKNPPPRTTTDWAIQNVSVERQKNRFHTDTKNLAGNAKKAKKKGGSGKLVSKRTPAKFGKGGVEEEKGAATCQKGAKKIFPKEKGNGGGGRGRDRSGFWVGNHGNNTTLKTPQTNKQKHPSAKSGLTTGVSKGGQSKKTQRGRKKNELHSMKT